MVVGRSNGQAIHADNVNENNNNSRVNELDGVRLRNGGTKLLSNGGLGVKREVSPSRDVISGDLHDRLKTASHAVQNARSSLEGLESILRDAARGTRPSRLELDSKFTPEWCAKERKRTEGSREKEKEFTVRNSPLTDLFALHHIATIYHIAIVVLIVLMFNVLVNDIVSTGSIDLSLSLMWFSFGGFHRVITIWICMFFSTLLVYAAFSQWAHRRRTMPAGSVARAAWDYGALAALVAYYCLFLLLPTMRLLHYSLPVCSAFALLMEQTRLLMKTHAFVRSNTPRALSDAASPDKKGSREIVCPGFSQFLYFLFAPTLIYKDSYPRTPVIRWGVVAGHMLEVVGAMFFVGFLCDRFMLPPFKDFGKQPVSILGLASLVLGVVVPAGFIYVSAFYLLLHSFQNAFAEMLRFGDRLFYKDWWNQPNFSHFYRTWNLLVQDWLHCYVYRDVQKLGATGVVPRVVVFVLSGIVHEYILAFSCGFFYPVLYIFFGVISLLLSFVPYELSRSLGNIGLWFSLFTGNGMLFGFYASEYYARSNCPRTIDSPLDYFVPRSWTCALQITG